MTIPPHIQELFNAMDKQVKVIHNFQSQIAMLSKIVEYAGKHVPTPILKEMLVMMDEVVKVYRSK